MEILFKPSHSASSVSPQPRRRNSTDDGLSQSSTNNRPKRRVRKRVGATLRGTSTLSMAATAAKRRSRDLSQELTLRDSNDSRASSDVQEDTADDTHETYASDTTMSSLSVDDYDDPTAVLAVIYQMFFSFKKIYSLIN